MLRFSMKRKCGTVSGSARLFSHVAFCFLPALSSLSGFAQSAPLVTTTQIRILANGSQTSSVNANTPVQLRATITDSDNTEVTPGQVLFCEIANGVATKGIMAACAVPIATAQTQGYSVQTGSGTSNYGQAVVTIYPLAGNHNYEAVFLGNSHYKVSASTAPLVASGTAATTTALAVSGAPSQYTLTATVNSLGPNAASGPVAFTDTTTGAGLGSASLANAMAFDSLTILSQPTVSDTGACSIASGDFNGDGIADFAVGVGSCVAPVGQNSAAPLQILLGKGDGTFTVTSLGALSNFNITALTAGDFNDDGTVDLIAATDQISPPGIGGSYTYGLLFLSGDGKGGFSSTTLSAPCTSDTYQMATADFNGDGNLDFAVNCEPTQNTTGVTKILLGNGTGGFTAGASVPGGNYLLNSFGIADFNGDGFPDLVVASDDSSGAKVYLNTGTGNFTAGPSFSLSMDGLVVGDFNGDGNADVAITSASSNSETVTLYPGNGSGAFAQPVATNIANMVGGSDGYSMVVADFNQDGITDIGMISGGTDAPSIGSALVLGSASGTFSVAANLQTQFTGVPDYFPGAVGDFNKDGIPDILMSSSDLNTAYAVAVGDGLTQTATLTPVNPIGAGTHNVTATYAGDSFSASSTSSSVSLTATPASTTLALTTLPASVTAGSQVALTAVLSPYDSGSLTTNGEQVTFVIGGQSIGTTVLQTGVATLNVTSLPIGIDSITAQYAGDNNFKASTSNAASVTVTSAVPTAPTLTPSTLTFSQTTVGGTSTAQSVTVQNTGTVALSISSIAASGNFAETNACGSSLAPGASCTVNVTFSPASVGTLTGTLTIADNASPQTQSVALSGQGVAATIGIATPNLPTGGVVVPTSGTTTVAVSFTPSAGITGGIAITCAVNFKGTGLPHHAPTCSVAPSSINVTNGATGNSTLTITTGSQNALLEHFDGGRGVALAGLLFGLCFLPGRRWRGALLALLCTVVLGFATGCTNNNASSGTTAGSYSVTVTATAGSTTNSLAIPFTVQ